MNYSRKAISTILANMMQGKKETSLTTAEAPFGAGVKIGILELLEPYCQIEELRTPFMDDESIVSLEATITASYEEYHNGKPMVVILDEFESAPPAIKEKLDTLVASFGSETQIHFVKVR